MPRKPIHLQAVGNRTPRERVWDAIRALKRFTYSSIEDRCPRFPDRTIECYVRALEKAGYVKRVTAHGRHSHAEFALVRDVGVEAPRLTKEGLPVDQGAKRLALWRAMKILKMFNVAELAAAAGREVLIADVKSYVHYLGKAGYLALVRKGDPHRLAQYRFIPARDSGPRAPMVQRVKHVYDPNLGAVVWRPEVRP
jgi:hypothetical protein